MKRGLARRLQEFGPADVQGIAREGGSKIGLVELVGREGGDPDFEAAIAQLVSRYRDVLWSARLEAAMFPRMVGEYQARFGIDPEKFQDHLPMVAIIREGDIVETLKPWRVFGRATAQRGSLVRQIDSFVYKTAITHTPKPKKVAEESGPAVNREKSFPVKVSRAGQTREIAVYENENLLQGSLDRGVELDYSCKQGKCDSCKVKVLKGGENLSAPTAGEKEMLADQIKEGYRLSCQVSVSGPVEVKQ